VFLTLFELSNVYFCILVCSSSSVRFAVFNWTLVQPLLTININYLHFSICWVRFAPSEHRLHGTLDRRLSILLFVDEVDERHGHNDSAVVLLGEHL